MSHLIYSECWHSMAEKERLKCIKAWRTTVDTRETVGRGWAIWKRSEEIKGKKAIYLMNKKI